MAQRTWTIKDILDWTRGDLERNGDEHPRLSAEWLLSAVTGKSRVQLYLDYDQPLEPDELAAMREAIKRRRAGEPLQYVTGEMPFRHIVLQCERGVLIPRPETEILVEEALTALDGALARKDAERDAADDGTEDGAPAADKGLPERDVADGDPADEGAASGGNASEGQGSASDEAANDGQGPDPADENPNGCDPADVPAGWARVVDLCCGTGCIALSMATERDRCAVWAGDLSPQAVALTARNRDALNLEKRVAVAEGDLFCALPAELMGTVDVLVSNPPYIPSAVVPTLPEEVVGYEPGLALDGGPDGLDLFRRLLEGAPVWLAPGGTFCAELFEGSLDTAAGLTRAQGGWAEVAVVNDLTGRPRVLVCQREG